MVETPVTAGPNNTRNANNSMILNIARRPAATFPPPGSLILVANHLFVRKFASGVFNSPSSKWQELSISDRCNPKNWQWYCATPFCWRCCLQPLPESITIRIAKKFSGDLLNHLLWFSKRGKISSCPSTGWLLPFNFLVERSIVICNFFGRVLVRLIIVCHCWRSAVDCSGRILAFSGVRSVCRWLFFLIVGVQLRF